MKCNASVGREKMAQCRWGDWKEGQLGGAAKSRRADFFHGFKPASKEPSILAVSRNPY